MKIIKLEKNNRQQVIEQAITVLQNDGLLVFPSDTVYGFLVDASNPKAIEKLISFKDRPPGKAISVFVKDIPMIEELCTLNVQTQKMLERLLPGPFTIVLPSKHKVNSLLESEKGSLGVRIPNFELVNELINQYGKPVTATSANVGGGNPHHSIESFLNQVPKKKEQFIDMIVDAGKLPNNKPSTVMDLTESTLKVLRKGDLVITEEETFDSKSPEETQTIAEDLLRNAREKYKEKQLVFILKGELGAGKTQFVKSIAAEYGIYDVISPTFVVYYEYDLPGTDRFKRLYHFDLYNIQDEEEFDHLGIEEIVKGENIICIEWGEKISSRFKQFQENGQVILVEITYTGKNEREITASYLG